MRLLAALALLASLSWSPAASAIELASTSEAIVHVAVSDAGEFIVAVSRDGTPSTLWMRSGGDMVALQLRFAGANLHCTIKRSGAHPFEYDGDVEQSRGRAVVVGRFPSDKGGMIDLKVRVTNDFNP
ncbi:MAG TPA: hypothetical protein VIA18_01030 [Polyangia bacterium]|jgi:hypothetical protein|nr:hypothetical protein [Polyangia bacterium]HWE30978.1 hypothetical protein [Polyangia bacterium]